MIEGKKLTLWGFVGLIWMCLLSLMACWFGFESLMRAYPGALKIAEFDIMGDRSVIYDVHSDKRACFIVATKFKNDENVRYFFNCAPRG